MKIIDSQQKDIVAELKRIINRGETATEEVATIVKDVVERVRKQGDPAVLVASQERAQRELGWEPQVPDLEAIMESAWRWHQAHPQGYPD